MHMRTLWPNKWRQRQNHRINSSLACLKSAETAARWSRTRYQRRRNKRFSMTLRKVQTIRSTFSWTFNEPQELPTGSRLDLRRMSRFKWARISWIARTSKNWLTWCSLCSMSVPMPSASSCMSLWSRSRKICRTWRKSLNLCARSFVSD